MRVYHRRGAGRPIRVVWTLEEIGTPYELVIVSAEEAGTRHPLGRVPVLEDDAGLLFESTALCLHVADGTLTGALGTRDRALVYQWAFFAMTEIEPPAVEALRRRSDAPELADAAAARVRTAVAVIDDALGESDYLVGDRFSVADVIVSEVVRVAVFAGAYAPAGPLASYLTRTEARPARARAAAQVGRGPTV